MALIVNTFKANLNPVEFTLPFVDYPSWEESTSAKAQNYPGQITCRYAVKEQSQGVDRIKLGWYFSAMTRRRMCRTGLRRQPPMEDRNAPD